MVEGIMNLVTQNDLMGMAFSAIGGGSILFTMWKGIDKAIDQYLKRLQPEKFFERLKKKSQGYADVLVNSVRYFDDKVIDPMKNNLPDSGVTLEELIVSQITDIQVIFNDAFDRSKLVIKDLEENV
jgi:hypothetical protein